VEKAQDPGRRDVNKQRGRIAASFGFGKNFIVNFYKVL
jgi:hypothetical protein